MSKAETKRAREAVPRENIEFISNVYSTKRLKAKESNDLLVYRECRKSTWAVEPTYAFIPPCTINHRNWNGIWLFGVQRSHSRLFSKKRVSGPKWPMCSHQFGGLTTVSGDCWLFLAELLQVRCQGGTFYRLRQLVTPTTNRKDSLINVKQGDILAFLSPANWTILVVFCLSPFAFTNVIHLSEVTHSRGGLVHFLAIIQDHLHLHCKFNLWPSRWSV